MVTDSAHLGEERWYTAGLGSQFRVVIGIFLLRSPRFVALLVVFALASVVVPLSTAQNAEVFAASGLPLTDGTNQFGVWANYSPNSFVFDGTSRGRKLFLLNLQYARVLLARRVATLKYTGDVIPVAFESQPTQVFLVNGNMLRNPAGTIYGAGASPIGLQLNFGSRRVQPFLSGSVGFLYFAQQVPVLRSSQFNYTANLGIGLEVFSGSGRSFAVGYKYHHLSNADSAPLNPGLDSNVFYTGFSFFRRK